MAVKKHSSYIGVFLRWILYKPLKLKKIAILHGISKSHFHDLLYVPDFITPTVYVAGWNVINDTISSEIKK